MAKTVDRLAFRTPIRVFSKALTHRKPISQKQFLHPDPHKKLTVMVQKQKISRALIDDFTGIWWEQE
jgi:hypothetical protein